jgi:hypothetical protein
MYGFHDPATGKTTAPFSRAFVKDLARRRGPRSVAFEAYRKSRDPDGLFSNEFLQSVVLYELEDADLTDNRATDR